MIRDSFQMDLKMFSLHFGIYGHFQSGTYEAQLPGNLGVWLLP